MKVSRGAGIIPHEAIANHAMKLLKDPLFSSLSIGVTFDGKKHIAHFGEIDKGQNNKPTDNTVYEIASVTKTLLAVLVSQAELEGKLSLDDDIRKYLDGDFDNLQYKDHPILIRHLLTHTASLPRWAPERVGDLFEDIDSQLPYKINKILSQYTKAHFFEDLNQLTIEAIPGIHYSYSSYGTELTTYIIEKIYSKSFDELISEKIASKAQMSDTRIKLNEEQLKRSANGYDMNGNLTIKMVSNLWGGGGRAKSTPSDLMNYMTFLLDPENKPAANSYNTLYDLAPFNGDENNKSGYFWVLNEDDIFGKKVSHHGGAYGMQNWLHIYPDTNLGISVITNNGGMRTGRKLDNLIQKILEEIHKVNS